MKPIDADFRMSNVDRGSALWYQVAIIVRLREETSAASVHEIGPGRGLCEVLLKHLGFTYSTLSSLPSQTLLTEPLLQESSEEEIADIVIAYQVLEHNSLTSFGTLLGKMSQLSRRHVVISLPVANPYIRFEFEPKLWSGYSTKSWSRRAITWYLPRKILPRPKSSFINQFAQSTRLASPFDEDGHLVMASKKHLWEVGERNARVPDLTNAAQQQGLRCVRISYAPFFPKQIFMEFEKSH